MEAPLDGAVQDLQPLVLLDAFVESADVVFLGELDHFIHEKADFRLLLCRYLLERGWRAFAEELGWSDGRRIAAFLRRETAELDRISLFGWTGDQRSNRDDRPTGVLRASFDAYPTALMRAEQTRFYAGLRRAAQGLAIAFFGLDMDGASGGGYADIEARLEPWRDRAAVRALLRALARAPGQSAAEEAERLAALLPAARPLEGEIGAAVCAELSVDLAALADSFAYVSRTYDAGSYEALRPGMAFREGCMKRRFADALRLAGGRPMALMAHGLHLAKDDRLLGAAPGVGPGGGLQPSLGHHIVQDLGLKAASIWMVHGEGEDSQPFPDLPRRLAYPERTLNRRLSALATPTLFPVTGAPAGLFDRPIGVGHMYNTVQPVTLAGQVDVILFLPRATPMQAA